MKPEDSEIFSEFWKPSQNCVLAKLSFKNDGKINTFLDKETLGTFSTYRSILFSAWSWLLLKALIEFFWWIILFFSSMFFLGTFFIFSISCWNSQFVHAWFSWPQWASVKLLFWTVYWINHLSPFHEDWFLKIYFVLLFGTYPLWLHFSWLCLYFLCIR